MFHHTTRCIILFSAAVLCTIPLQAAAQHDSTRVVEAESVVVTARAPDTNVASPQTGVETMTVRQMNRLPVLFGERDIIKTILLTPGVKTSGDGSTGFYVRGGTADQNQVMLDHVPLYNASHMIGFFSTFNSDVLQGVTLYKGSIPAQFGERLSSVLDVRQRNGNNERIGVTGGIGLISSRLSIEGPIQKGRSSFIVAARRTYADFILHVLGVDEAKDKKLYFYDLNARATFDLSSRDQLTFSGYFGKDKLEVEDAMGTSWGTGLASLRWRHIVNDNLYSYTSLFYNRYKYEYGMSLGMDLYGQGVTTDYGGRQEFVYTPSERSQWTFGLSSTYHDIAPGDFRLNSSEQSNALNLYHRYSLESALYASGQFKIGKHLEVIAGMRLSAFMVMGGGEYYTLDANRNVTDSTWYGRGQVVKTYINPEPRLSAVWKFNERSSAKAAYTRTSQSLFLLSYMAQGTPYDRWASANNNLRPQTADQVSLGYFRNFADNRYELSIEAYYKAMHNQLDYRDNADIATRNVIETELLSGHGRAYGIELALHKRTGRLTGWVSYTWSKTEKQIDGINNDQWYPAYQDRTHDISVVGVWDVSPKWSLSFAWVYYTGNAITYPSGKYTINGKDVMYYAERNGYRAPAYHRLDLGATCTLKKTKRYESELVFSLYNAYGRRNAYMISFRTDDDDPSKTTAYRYTLFTFVPSVSWNFKF